MWQYIHVYIVGNQGLKNIEILSNTFYFTLTILFLFSQDNSIYHANTQKCMETSVDGQKLTMKTCTGVDRQIWTWKRKSPSGMVRN